MGYKIHQNIPCIALKGEVPIPEGIISINVGREKSVAAMKAAIDGDKLVYAAAQSDINEDEVSFNSMYDIGCICRIETMMKITPDTYRVVLKGMARASIDEYLENDEYLLADVIERPWLIDEEDLTHNAITKLLAESVKQYFQSSGNTNQELLAALKDCINKPLQMIGYVTTYIPIPYEKQQQILENDFLIDVQKELFSFINNEIQVIRLEREIDAKLKKNIDESQREYYLREKIKTINSELGYDEDIEGEIEEYRKKLEALDISESIKEKISKEINRIQKGGVHSADAQVARSYVETILELPWNNSSKLNQDLKKASSILDKDHYGMEKVKKRIVEYLAVTYLVNEIKGPILCLVGPPGVGKTSVAKSIATATGREFVRMALGGVTDESEIRGHRRTYIGAIPGRIINALKDEAKTNNPVFLLDEIDKLGSDFKGDPASALLEALDPEQNKTFTDRYLEVPFDLSKVLFITTANSTDTIPRPLLDRMEVIELSGYTDEEKIKIAQTYIVPKQIKSHGLDPKKIKFRVAAIREIISYYTRESGVRGLERNIASICRYIAKEVVINKKEEWIITPQLIGEILGKRKFLFDKISNKNQVGTATGMAWTAVGGDTLSVEIAVVPGSGKLSLTGNLGDVMQESAKAALSYIRANSKKLKIDEDFYKNKDIHLHVPEGAVPKDGPSAGVTIATAMASALTDIPVRKDVSMTGEITLRGKILPVGGIKEKVLAANRAGIKKVLLPMENERDMDEIPENVKKNMEFVFMEDAAQAFNEAFVK